MSRSGEEKEKRRRGPEEERLRRRGSRSYGYQS